MPDKDQENGDSQGNQNDTENQSQIDLSAFVTRGKPTRKRKDSKIDLKATLTASEPQDDRVKKLSE